MPRDVKPFLVLSNHPYLKTAGSAIQEERECLTRSERRTRHGPSTP
jgi:hypothetical protein